MVLFCAQPSLVGPTSPGRVSRAEGNDATVDPGQTQVAAPPCITCSRPSRSHSIFNLLG